MEKLPSISKNVWCLAVLPTLSISLVLMHFWTLVNLGFDGLSLPSKYFLSGATPALIHKSVGSFWGTSEADASILCFLRSKKDNHVYIICSAVM
jgi:hypothetical protein